MTTQIFIKTLVGKSICFDVNLTDTVESLKTLVNFREGVPNSEQRLIYMGKQLVDKNILSDYNIQADSTIYLVLRLKG
ncbi:MAG: ubiquitin [Faunusvirus sp.]|jgi:hypothetical protein|uniref:Ubiquitin n=1 Tax=Faunusvirus sp. TaxID=2487766 RepID=A0A3G5A0C0_9VIRU|nr:MAG: ubiquitin [Faunusvirus sp.]